jgi:hypothetical protein
VLTGNLLHASQPRVAAVEPRAWQKDLHVGAVPGATLDVLFNKSACTACSLYALTCCLRAKLARLPLGQYYEAYCSMAIDWAFRVG